METMDLFQNQSIAEPLSAQYVKETCEIRDTDGKVYNLSVDSVLEASREIARKRLERMGQLTSPNAARQFLREYIGNLDYEVFVMILMDCRHRIQGVVELFRGTIDGASVYPREVVKLCLNRGSQAVCFAHNHPSSLVTPSAADRALTKRLVNALALVEVTVIDHFVIGAEETLSFSEKGLL